MRRLLTTTWFVFVLAGCFYPEVDEGGFSPTPDGGNAGAGGNAGTGGGFVNAASWCPSTTFNVPCECEGSYTSAARTCTGLIQAASADENRRDMSSCINSCYTNTACGEPYCGCVDLCLGNYGGRLNDADQRAVYDAYACLISALRDRCSTLP